MIVAAVLAALALVAVILVPGPTRRATPGFTPAAATPTPNQANVGLPVRLTIPSLAVDAKIELMGVTSTGEMDVPTNVLDAGWYKFGPHPGDVGSAVIGGHLDGIHAEPGVFINLDRLRIGDKFSILDDTGKTSNFIVSKTKTYAQNSQPDEVFHSNVGAHVNLITCTGAWDKANHRFASRLVVFGDKVD